VVGGTRLYDVLVEHADSRLVFFEIFIVENDDAAGTVGGSFGFAERSYDYLASLRARRR
jgi:hypothetical protein